MSVILITYYLIASSVGLILVKMFFNSVGLSNLSVNAILDFRLFIGAILYITSFLTWFILLSKNDLSYIYPIVVGLGYIVIMLLSYFILKEQIRYMKLIGSILILAGVFIMALKWK